MELIIVIIAVAILALVGGAALLVGRGRGGPDTIDAPPPADTLGIPPDTVEIPDSPEGIDTLEPPVVEEPVVEAPPRATFADRLGKARAVFADYIGSILSRGVDEQTWEELEEAMLRADVGISTTTEILDAARAEVAERKVTDSAEALEIVKTEVTRRLAGRDIGLETESDGTAVWLFVGVNGVGKTTTIGKLARREGTAGRSVVLAAGDTFRAAAAEQLAMWAERSDAAIVRGAEGGDPSSVIFDAVEHAAARDADLVMADTAGRLHTKTNLMEELRKVRRVAEKGAGVVTEVLLVIDATTGQNGLVQARQFTEAVEVTGVVLTKLDGSAKGGIVMAIQGELDIPVKLVGLGEGPEDLIAFDAEQFVEALFAA